MTLNTCAVPTHLPDGTPPRHETKCWHGYHVARGAYRTNVGDIVHTVHSWTAHCATRRDASCSN